MIKKYRPWGRLQWLLEKYPKNLDWFFCGAISFEDRTLESYRVTCSLAKITDSYFFEIEDRPSRFESTIKRKLTRIKLLPEAQNIISNIYHFNLMDVDLDSLICDHIDKIVGTNYPNIIIDISCLPKKFFFLLVKRAYHYRSKIKNLIVTQTIADSYPSGDLAESPEPWSPLSPLFRGDDDAENYHNFFVGVGHLPMGAPEQIREICRSSKIYLLFPFPGSVSSFGPTWKFVHEIEKNVLRSVETHHPIKVEHISAINTPELYDFFVNETNSGTELSMFLPYGPKSFSLAIALFTSKYPHHPVYYTQPKIYRPDYSLGIRKENGESVISAYSIIANGKNLYW